MMLLMSLSRVGRIGFIALLLTLTLIALIHSTPTQAIHTSHTQQDGALQPGEGYAWATIRQEEGVDADAVSGDEKLMPNENEQVPLSASDNFFLQLFSTQTADIEMDPHQVQEEFSSFLESPSFLESGSSTRTASMTRSSSTKASVLTMTPAQFKARVLNTKTWRGREKGRKPRLAKAKAKAKATTPAKSKKTSTSASKTAEKKTAPTAGSGRSAGMSGKTGGKSGKTSGQSGGTSGKSGKTSGQSGGTSGKSGKTSGQSGRTSGKSGKTSGQSGGASGKSGKTSGQSGRTSGKSGKTSGQSGGASGKSGKTSGESGRGSGKSGKTSGTSGRDGGKSGKTSGTSGKDGGKSGKTSGTSGKDGGKSGKTSGTGGKDSGKSGKTSGNGSKKKATSNDPARVALPPSQKQKKASTAAEQKRMEESGEWISKMVRIAVNQTTASVAGKRGRELAIASMLAAGVSQADIDKVLQTLLGMTIRNGAVGFAGGVSEQLGTCASCWAYTAADALQRIHLRLGDVLSRVPLSSQQLIDCVKSVDTKGCMGGSPLDALDYWQKNAVALLSEYPSKPTAGKCKPYASVTQRPPVYASYGWDMLIPACDDMTGDCKKQVQYEHLLVDWVKLGGTAPIVYIDATNMQNHKGSIFDISKCQSTMEAGNHVVQIIGFSTDPETGAPFWMLQNSWGPDWGEYGRMRVPFGLNACGLANFVIVPTDPAMSHQSGAGSSTTTEQTLQNLRATTQQLATASPLKANLGSPTPSLTPAGSQSFTSQVNANRAAAAAAGQPAPAPSTVQRGASFDDPFLQAILDGKIPASGTIVQGVIQNTPK